MKRFEHLKRGGREMTDKKEEVDADENPVKNGFKCLSENEVKQLSELFELWEQSDKDGFDAQKPLMLERYKVRVIGDLLAVDFKTIKSDLEAKLTGLKQSTKKPAKVTGGNAEPDTGDKAEALKKFESSKPEEKETPPPETQEQKDEGLLSPNTKNPNPTTTPTTTPPKKIVPRSPMIAKPNPAQNPMSRPEPKQTTNKEDDNINPTNITPTTEQPQDKFTLMERKDEDQIMQELEGRVLNEYVYKFRSDGREVTGLSWAGIKRIAQKMGNITTKIVSIDGTKEDEPSYRVIVEAVDLTKHLTMVGVSEQSKVVTTKTGLKYKDNFALQKAMSKAQRNALRNLMPEPIIAEMIKEWQSKHKQN